MALGDESRTCPRHPSTEVTTTSPPATQRSIHSSSNRTAAEEEDAGRGDQLGGWRRPGRGGGNGDVLKEGESVGEVGRRRLVDFREALR